MDKTVEVKVEISENELKFLEALSAFTGKPVKDMLSYWMKGMISCELDSGWKNLFGISWLELKERFGFRTDSSDEEGEPCPACGSPPPVCI